MGKKDGDSITVKDTYVNTDVTLQSRLAIEHLAETMKLDRELAWEWFMHLCQMIIDAGAHNWRAKAHASSYMWHQFKIDMTKDSRYAALFVQV